MTKRHQRPTPTGCPFRGEISQREFDEVWARAQRWQDVPLEEVTHPDAMWADKADSLVHFRMPDRGVLELIPARRVDSTTFELCAASFYREASAPGTHVEADTGIGLYWPLTAGARVRASGTWTDRRLWNFENIAIEDVAAHLESMGAYVECTEDRLVRCYPEHVSILGVIGWENSIVEEFGVCAD